MTATLPTHDMAQTRAAAWCGMAAPVVFLGVAAVEGALRPGYDPAAQFVSELSDGPRGWVQIGSFLVTGTLVVAFARGTGPLLGAVRTARAAAVALQVLGCCLVLSGFFVTDPSAMFDQSSWHGVVHGLVGAVAFTLMPVSCALVGRGLRQAEAGFARWSVAAAVALVAGIVLLKVAQTPGGPLFDVKGLVQRAVLVVFFVWLFALAVLLRHRARQGRVSVQAG